MSFEEGLTWLDIKQIGTLKRYLLTSAREENFSNTLTIRFPCTWSSSWVFDFLAAGNSGESLWKKKKKKKEQNNIFKITRQKQTGSSKVNSKVYLKFSLIHLFRYWLLSKAANKL